jgi:tetratricopeptide (TPR) repeat protein
MARLPVAGLLVLGLLHADECKERLTRATEAFQKQSYAVAAAEFEQAAQLCPQRARILVSLAQVQFLLHKQIEAEQSLKAAIQLEPRNAEALYALGRIYSQQHRYLEAVVQLKKVIELEPAHYRAWDNLGVCYDALSQDSDALRSFFKALNLVMKDHPQYDWAHANLADFFLRRNESEKAFQLAAEAARRNPDSARNCFLAGKALVNLGKEDLSLRWLERAVQIDPSYSEAWYLAARAYRKQGRPEDSGKALERFKTLQKGSEKQP